MLKKILETVKTNNMLDSGNVVVVGVSGGADSICLLHILTELREVYHLKIIAVHINHGIRGDEAKHDEQFVLEVCNRLNVELVIKEFDIPSIAKETKKTLEEAGRDIRYSCFSEVAHKYQANKIAVAHNKNDNVETVLMRIIRGTGTKGLCGISSTRGNIVRPLINVSRREIESYCRENKLEYHIDSTNLESSYTRNKIRLKLIPTIEEEFHSDLLGSITRMANLISEDEKFLDELTFEKLTECRVCRNSLNIEKLRQTNLSLKRRVIRALYLEISDQLSDISYEHIEKIIELMDKETGKRVSLPNDVNVCKSYNELVFYRGVEVANNFSYNIKLDEAIYIFESNIFIKASLNEPDIIFPNSCTKVFNYDKMESIIIRNRQANDKIFVKSIGGNKKLKDYFIDEKIPKEQRSLVPILFSSQDSNDSVWILDKKNIVSDTYKSRDTDRKVYIQKWEVN